MEEQQLTVDYFGFSTDQNGAPDPWYRFWIVAGRGPFGLWVATIISLGESLLSNGSTEHIAVKQGGIEAAIAEAERRLDEMHRGLQKRWHDRDTVTVR